MDNIEIFCQTSYRIENIPDINVKPTGPNIVGYQPSRHKILTIDFGSPELHQYVGNAMGYAMQKTPAPAPDDANSKIEWGQHYVYMLNRYIGLTPLPDEDMAQRWEQEWTGSVPGQTVTCELGYLMCVKNVAKCRERSIMLHILLAQFGIPTRVIHTPGHAWVVCDDKDGNTVLGLDPGHRIVLRRAAGEDPLQNHADQEWFGIVKPRRCKRFFSDPNFIWTLVPPDMNVL